MGKVREVLLDCKDKVQSKRPAPERLFSIAVNGHWCDYEERRQDRRGSYSLCHFAEHINSYETLSDARLAMRDGDAVYEYQLVAKYRCKTERE